MQLNLEGVLTGLGCLAVIGLFHPIVIWCEYYFTDRVWPVFLAAGAAFLGVSLLLQGLPAALCGVTGAACLWSIRELKEQTRRVEKGFFPQNPRRHGETVTLETERLILRPWRESDAGELYRYASDPRVGPNAGWPPHTSVQDSRRVIREVFSWRETYAIVLKSTGKPVGSIGLMFPGTGSAPLRPGQAEIGYWVGVPYWGHGLAPEAVRELCRRAFEDLDCTGLWCGYYDGNEKSRRVQEKCGFVPHHTEEDKPCPLGDRRTEHFTYLDREAWRQSRAAPQG